MWFKFFVLLRTPVSAFLLLGYGIVSVALLLGAYVFLAAASIKLVKRRRGALTLAGWLLALETIGAVLLVGGGNYIATRAIDPIGAFAVACVVVVVWVLPNAAILYSQRGKFVDQKQKPGL